MKYRLVLETNDEATVRNLKAFDLKELLDLFEEITFNRVTLAADDLSFVTTYPNPVQKNFYPKTDCPQCSATLVFPRDDIPYCEECGYPEENRPAFFPE